MPQQYCMLTGYWEKGLLYDFDYSYFLNPGVDIEGFDPSMAKMYRQMFIDGDGRLYNYRPTQPLNKRTGKYAYWGQTSPEDGSWVKPNSSSKKHRTAGKPLESYKLQRKYEIKLSVKV